MDTDSNISQTRCGKAEVDELVLALMLQLVAELCINPL